MAKFWVYFNRSPRFPDGLKWGERKESGINPKGFDLSRWKDLVAISCNVEKNKICEKRLGVSF